MMSDRRGPGHVGCGVVVRGGIEDCETGATGRSPGSLVVQADAVVERKLLLHLPAILGINGILVVRHIVNRSVGPLLNTAGVPDEDVGNWIVGGVLGPVVEVDAALGPVAVASGLGLICSPNRLR